jgi:hypothetical protein
MDLKQWCDNNWYYLKDKIDFTYWRYWDWYVSVTEILKLIWDPWFEYVMKYNEDKVKEAAIKWTEVHKQAEDFFTPKSWVIDVNQNFMKFHTLYDVTILKQEETYYRDSVRWTIDCVGKVMYENPYTIPSYYITNIDYKNSAKHSPKYLLQLAWYKWLNWNVWILVYWKWKLKVIEYTSELDNIWIELVDLFFKLKNNETNWKN